MTWISLDRALIGFSLVSLFSIGGVEGLWALEAMASDNPGERSPLHLAQQTTLNRAEIYDLGSSVQVLPRNQSARAANLGDVLVPLDSLQTAAAASSFAELLFNEGSIARVDQDTTFFFRQGLRRFQLPNRIALNETIFVLEDGVALIMSPPNSTGTQVETPGAVITILSPTPVAAVPSDPSGSDRLAQAAPVRDTTPKVDPTALQLTQAESSPVPEPEPEGDLLLPPDRSTVVMVAHDADRNLTQVFALTDGDITVSDRAGEQSVRLIGGETVAVTEGQLGDVQTFSLESFYRAVPLAAGLGPDQEDLVLQEPEPVQPTLNAVRLETLAAVRRQEREREGFTSTFLRDALNGIDSGFPEPVGGDDRRRRGVNDRDFNGQRGTPSVVIRQDPGSPIEGTFRDGAADDDRVRATFTPDNDPNNPIPINGNIETRRVTIDGETGTANNVGISGDDAVGEVILDNGRVIRIEVFGVGGDAPDADRNFPGRLIEGIAPDY